MKMEPTVSSETSEIRPPTPGNHPKRNKLHLEHGESLKTRKFFLSARWRHGEGIEVSSSYSLLPRQMEVDGQLHAPSSFTPGNDRYPLNRGLCGPQSLPGYFEEEKSFLPLLGFEPRTVQPVDQSLYRPHYSSVRNIRTKTHHHKHQGLDPLIRSVSRVTAVRDNASGLPIVLLPCGL